MRRDRHGLDHVCSGRRFCLGWLHDPGGAGAGQRATQASTIRNIRKLSSGPPTVGTVVTLLLLAGVGPVTAQEEQGWTLAATVSALHIDDALADELDDGWGPAVGLRVDYRVDPKVTLGGAMWWADAEPTLWAAGVGLSLAPWGGRPLPLQPEIFFGVDFLSVDDDLDRGPAFVFGVGAEKRLGRWTIEPSVRNRFLTVDEEPIDGVSTGRDASLWEIALALGYVFGR